MKTKSRMSKNQEAINNNNNKKNKKNISKNLFELLEFYTEYKINCSN